jgi:hypothetical protein
LEWLDATLLFAAEEWERQTLRNWTEVISGWGRCTLSLAGVVEARLPAYAVRSFAAWMMTGRPRSTVQKARDMLEFRIADMKKDDVKAVLGRVLTWPVKGAVPCARPNYADSGPIADSHYPGRVIVLDPQLRVVLFQEIFDPLAPLRGLLPVGVEVRNVLVRDLSRIVIEIARRQDVPGVGELAPRLRPCVFGLH